MSERRAQPSPQPPAARAGLRRWLVSPDDPFVADRVRIARPVEATAGVALVGLVALLPLRQDATWVDFGLYAGIGTLLGLMALLRARYSGVSGFIGGAGFVVLVTIAAWFREGFGSGVTSGAYALAVVVGGLLWGPGKTLWLAAIASMASALLLWATPFHAAAPLRSWGEVTAILVTLSLFVEISMAALARRTTEVQASRKRFQHLFDASPDALILIDGAARIQLWNRTARAFLPLEAKRDDLLTSFENFRAQTGEAIRAALAAGNSPGPRSLATATSETVSLLPGRSHELTVTPLTAEDTATQDQFLVTIRDVTERVSAAAARREFESRVANSKSLEALGRLAGGVAHDFNNLLTVILGTSELMLRLDPGDQKQRANLGSIRHAAERAAELTSQLLAFGRKQVLDASLFCPNDSLAQLHPLLVRLIPANIDLKFQAAPDLGLARLDPARLEQVLVNLVTNARDAMPNGGSLRITTENRSCSGADADARGFSTVEVLPPGNYVAIRVEDTGVGMDEATRAQIFEPFFTTKALGKGTGLGLATVFGVVQQSGGHIRVRSELGKGTVFELLFPRLDAPVTTDSSREPAQPSTGAERSLSAPLRALDVLLVEDAPHVRTSVASMLEAAGHRVCAARDTLHAVSLIMEDARQFDLLLTDVMMPQANGPELASLLRQERPEMRVLFITGYSYGIRPEVPATSDGGVDYLLKPFTFGQLDAKIRGLFADDGAVRQASSR